MAIATGVNKIVGIKKESTWGVLAGASGAQLVTRLESDLSLKKDTYKSEELTSTFQVTDMQHGVRRAEGSWKGELAPGAQQLVIAAAVRQTFAAVSAIATLTLTIAASGSAWTITRSAGNWWTDGVKIGQVGRITAGGFAAPNLNKNLLIIASSSATVITVMPLNGVALTPEGPISSGTWTTPGKYAFMPSTAQTDDSFTIEHWYSDVAQSEQFTGMKVSQQDYNLPPTGLTEINTQFLGKDMVTGTSQYFTSPTAASTARKLGAVNGLLILNGTAVALLTGLSFSINGNMTSEAVVGSNTYPDIFEGRMVVEGQATVMFQDGVARDMFTNGTEVGLIAAIATGSGATDDFMSFAFPRIKFKSADKSDGEKALIQTMSFDALYLGTGGASTANNATTMQIHDSLAA